MPAGAPLLPFPDRFLMARLPKHHALQNRALVAYHRPKNLTPVYLTSGRVPCSGYSYYDTRSSPGQQRGRQQQYTYSYAEGDSDEEGKDTWSRSNGGTNWEYH